MPLALLDLTTPTPEGAIDPTRDALSRIPLALWALRALRLAADDTDIVVAASDDHDTTPFEHFPEVTVCSPADANLLAFDRAPPGPMLVANCERPFCTRETARAAAGAPSPELHRLQSTPIERTRITNAADLELAQAIADGLAVDHPAIDGITAYAAPFLADVEAVVVDVDGTLTDGAVYMPGDVDAEPIRKFDTRDGQGLRMLMKNGVKLGVLSSTYRGQSSVERARMLKIEHMDIGPGDKRPRFLALCNEMGVEPAKTLYFGDDINDLVAMEVAGFVACPADAHPIVRRVAHVVLQAAGGHHAARELSDLILGAKRADLAVPAQ